MTASINKGNESIAIVGAGPVGSYAAQLLAKKGFNVRVFEEHGEIGRPVQCTGIVTRSITDSVRLRKDFLVNRLRKVRLHSPDGNSAEAKINDIVIDRTRFDNHLAECAMEKGAKFFLNSRVEEITSGKSGNCFRLMIKSDDKTMTRNAGRIIGAEGPNSVVSRHLGNKKPECWIGVQAVTKMHVEKDTYEVYFSYDIPGFFGWVVPENEITARVGIATTKNPKQTFERFMKRFERCKVISMQGGLIPRYNPRLTLSSNGLYIVGDAATQVKATTGGGLVPGLKAAECLARSIVRDTDYRHELKPVTKELKMSLLLRGVLDRFNEKDYNELVRMAGLPSIRKILNQNDRDTPSKIIFKSILHEPKLLLFLKTLARAKRL
jgi:geranylgeranyl reductase family protein